MANLSDLRIRISADGSQAARGLAQVQTGLGRLSTEAGTTQRQMAALQGAFRGFASQLAAGIGVAVIAREFVAAATEAQKFEKSLAAVTGSSAAAAQEMEYIRATANKMGLTLADTANAYISLSAAAKGTALEGKATKDIFESVSLAMGKLGKSSADTQGALLALEQMISKGKVSAEELRGQLGERLPGAFKAAADAMGVTTAELDAMLVKGELMAEDLLPALSQRLREIYDDGNEIGGLEAEWNRLTNALSAMASEADRATGITNALARAIQYATGLANDWASAIRAVSNASQGLGFTMADRDELAILYRKRTDQVNEYLAAVERANNAADLTKTPGLAAARDEALKALADTERAIQSARQATRDTYNQQREDSTKLAASMMDGPVKAFRAQQAATAEANQELLKLTGSYDKAVAKQVKIAEATTKYQEIAKSLGKDEAWIAEQVEKYTQGLESNTASQGKASKARGGTAKATQEATKAEREYNRAIAETERAVQGLISRYLPARQAADDYAQAQQAVAAALAGQSGSVALSAEEASQILDGLARDQAAAADAARREADGFYAAWADAVDSLDDTFQGLWRGLISGQGDVLSDLKENVLEWIADLSYQLLLSPLVVPIQGALMGMMGGGAGGAVGGMVSGAGSTGGLFNAFSSLSSLANGMTSIFSGAALTGIVNGFNAASGVIGASGYFGGFGANMAMASGAASAGNASFAIGAMAPYALPVAAIAAVGMAIFSKWQKDQEPRYGTIAAMTGGSVRGLEDWENGPANYSRGAFGLTFGITDKGSKNIKASELKKTYDALSQVTDALAQFFGEDLSNFIEDELKNLSTFGDGLIHLTENEGDLGAAMAMLIEHIAQAAGKSSEDIGIAFAGMVGDLGGTAEEVAEQIQSVMAAATLAVELSARFDDRIGKMLGLTGEIDQDVVLLRGYVDQFGTAGETSAATLGRLVAQLGMLEQAAVQTGTDLSGYTAEALIQLSDDLVKSMGGVDQAAEQMSFYYQQFTSEAEKLADAVAAAADAIAREIPRLQDELMALSEDVTTTVTTLVEEIQEGVKGLSSTPETSTGDYWADMHDKLVDRFGEDMARMMVSIQAEGTAVADGVDDYWAKMREKVVTRFGEDAARMITAVSGAADNAVEKIVAESQKVTKTVTTETTTPGDPNAAILARLLDDLPKTRQGFEDLIGAIDLTTEAGRRLYAGLMELAPQFDLLYDGVEAFSDWLLGVDDMERATRELERVFQDLGIAMPSTREALEELYNSGMLTAEQMATLAAYLRELGIVFGNVGDTVKNTIDKVQDYTDLYIRLAEAQGNSDLALQLRRQQELNNAADEYTRVLLRQIYAAEDAARALEEAEAARRAAWEESERLRRAAYDAEVEAIRAWNNAAQEAANAANQAAREALQAMQQAAEDAYQAATGIATAWIQAISALGLVAEATALQRRLESAAMDPEVRAAYSQVWAVQDRAAIAGGQANLALQALALLGRESDALAAQRQLTLAGTDPALQALQSWVFELEDARAAADEAAAGIEELIGSLEQVSSAIATTIDRIDQLLQASPAVKAQRRAEAQANLADLLAAARAGEMPTTAALERPLATLGEDPAALYGSRVDYLRDLGRTRGQLAELQAIVDAQIPIEQQNLEALKNLPNALYPNFEEIVAAIGTRSDDTDALLAKATAAIEAAIAAQAARDEAMRQTVKEITPAVREIPPYVEQVYEVGTQIKAAVDQNGDGIISKMEEQYPTLASLADDITSKMATIDLNVDGMVTFEEFQLMFGGLASATEMQQWFDRLDYDQNGIIDANELMIAKLTTGNSNENEIIAHLYSMITKLTTENTNSATQITNLQTQINKSNEIITQLQLQITKLQNVIDKLTSVETKQTTQITNQNTQISHESKLPTIYDRLYALWGLTDTANSNYWNKLPYIGDRMSNVEQYAYTANNSYLNKLPYIGDRMWNVEQYTYGVNTKFGTTGSMYKFNESSAQNLKNLVTGTTTIPPWQVSYATGGISSGPTSGYPVTLHGREAVIPLGDGNSVTAYLQEPPAPPPNYLTNEARDSAELRQALAELHGELSALRRDTQTIGAGTIGEMKEHNRRERRRDVTGTLVEVMS